jgi:hypothetical protein
MSPRVKATRRLWASTTSSRVDWARRGGEGTRRWYGRERGSVVVTVMDADDEDEDEDDEEEEEEEEEEEAWKVAPFRRDMVVLTGADDVEGVTEDLLERRGWLRDMLPGAT